MWRIILFVLSGRFLLRFISIYKTETSKRICLFYGKNWTLLIYKNSRDSSDFYGHVFVGLLLFRELILATLHQRTHFTSDQFFKKKIWWKPVLAYFVTCTQWIPQIHLWCNTCWPLGSLHDSWVIHPHTCAQALELESRILFRVILLKIRMRELINWVFRFNYNCQWIHRIQQILQKQWCTN